MSTEKKPNNALSDGKLSKVGGGADNPNDSTMVKYRCNETKCGSTNVEMYWEGM
ncbi:MAG: hypothetical protein K6F34_09040 [Lachnospiraceae bacterium]|nr:hypothetical protein [Lachnospiraceae bacterium]